METFFQGERSHRLRVVARSHERPYPLPGRISRRRAPSAKLLACVCGYVLYQTASHKPLAIMAGLYIGVAIAPWLLVLGGIVV